MAASYYDQPPPAGAPPRRSAFLKSSASIVLRNLHHLLYLPALFLLLSYLLITASTSLRSLLCDLSLFLSFSNLAFLTYALTYGETTWSLAGLPAYNYNTPIFNSVDPAAVHQLYDPPAASWGTAWQVLIKLSFIVFSILSVLNGTVQAFEAPKMVEICRDFGIVMLLGALGGAMYAVQRLARTSDAGGENMLMQEPALQKSYDSRSAAIARSMMRIGHCVVKASTWVSGIAWALTLIWWWWSGAGDDEGEADRHAGCSKALFIIGAPVVGVCVMGLPAVLWAGVHSTKASLDMSIRQFYSDGHAHKSTSSYHTFDAA